MDGNCKKQIVLEQNDKQKSEPYCVMNQWKETRTKKIGRINKFGLSDKLNDWIEIAKNELSWDRIINKSLNLIAS